jgi:hypothetical protein
VKENNDPTKASKFDSFCASPPRCLDEDLVGTTAADAERPVGELAHELVLKFVSMRSQDPKGRR